MNLTPHPSLAGERVLAVLSPNNIQRLPWIKHRLGAVFPKLDVVAPRDLPHLRDVVSRASATHRVVLTVGGDGTLHEVLNAADLSRQVLGILPGGTGNDFARAAGLPLSLGAALSRLAALGPQPVDIGVVNGLRYHTCAGFGLDSATLRLRQVRRNLLTRNYNIAFLIALAGLKCPQVSLDVDGEQTQGRLFWLLAMNTPTIGGGTRIAPEARIDDGLLELLLIRETGKLNLIRHMPAALRGKHLGLPFVLYRQAQRVLCRLKQKLDYLAVDGELRYCGESTVTFEVRPGAMLFLR